MPTTTANAVDEMLALVKQVADTFAGVSVRWPGVEQWAPPGADAAWWHVTLQHNEGGQGSLSCEHGLRRWNRQGLLTVQCFAPRSGLGLKGAREHACALRDLFQKTSTPGGVWFRGATANEVGPDASWYQCNFNVFFDYDEVR